MKNLKSIFALIMVLGLLGMLTGCGGDDNPTAPPRDTLTLDSAMAEDFTLQALEVVSGMVTEVPDFASADFGSWSLSKAEFAKVNTDTVAWDPAQNAWVFSYAGPLFEMESPSYWNMTLDLWVQYRNAGGALRLPLGATVMEVRYGTGMDMHMVEGQETTDLAYEMNTGMTVSYLGDGTAYGVVGTGDTVMEVATVSPQGAQNGRVSMAWTLDVTVSDAGCPAGTATFTAQQWQMVANYDGQGNANWTLTGPDYQGSGTETMGCGQPVN